jgi:hypothetical protein
MQVESVIKSDFAQGTEACVTVSKVLWIDLDY